MYKLNKNIKIVLAILSTLNIYLITNWSTLTIHDNSTLFNFFVHETGSVCPFGVICGKIMVIVGIIQIIYLHLDRYEEIKFYNILFLVLGVLFSFLNRFVCNNILPAFIMQFGIIYL